MVSGTHAPVSWDASFFFQTLFGNFIFLLWISTLSLSQSALNPLTIIIVISSIE